MQNVLRVAQGRSSHSAISTTQLQPVTGASTCRLSNGSSSRGLIRSMAEGALILRLVSRLDAFQRFSCPDMATQLWR